MKNVTTNQVIMTELVMNVVINVKLVTTPIPVSLVLINHSEKPQLLVTVKMDISMTVSQSVKNVTLNVPPVLIY